VRSFSGTQTIPQTWLPPGDQLTKATTQLPSGTDFIVPGRLTTGQLARLRTLSFTKAASAGGIIDRIRHNSRYAKSAIETDRDEQDRGHERQLLRCYHCQAGLGSGPGPWKAFTERCH
jgi:hypothetical protein